MEIYWRTEKRFDNVANKNVIDDLLFNLKTAGKKKILIERYRMYLQAFFKDRKDLFSSVTLDEINQWLADPKKNWKERTRKDYKKVIRYFYNYCVKQGYMDCSPFIDLKGNFGVSDEYWELKKSIQNSENEKIINAYLARLKATEKSKSTIQQSRTMLQRFFKNEERLYKSFTTEDIHQWISEHQNKWTNSFENEYRYVLTTFFCFCVEEGYMQTSPLNKKRWVKVAENYWEVQQPFANKKNQHVVNEYLLNSKNKNQTKKTIEEKRIVLQQFFRERKTHFSLITANEVEDWFEQHQNNRKIRTVGIYLTFLRSFFRYTVQKEYIEHNPVKYLYKTSEEQYWELTKAMANEDNLHTINEYLLYMKIANFSEGTIYNAKRFLGRFFKNIEESFAIISSEYIRSWFIKHQNKYKERTVTNYLSILSSFYKFTIEEEYLEKSPIKSIWYPHLPKPIPKYLEDSELSKVRFESEKESLRNRAILEFFLTSGCRVSELFLLNKSDINFENHSARVLGKGKKIRTVHFTSKCAIILERYLESRTDNEPALFISHLGLRLGVTSIRKIIRKIGILAEVSSSVYPHRLRHTFATRLLKNGADLLFIAEELGHNDVQTTRVYAHLPKKELITMYRKYMG